MAREWKPGDVAMGKWPECASGEDTFSERRIVRFDGLSSGWARADDPDDYLLDDDERSPTSTARPLAVIDPEDAADFVGGALRHIQSTLALDHTDCGLVTDGIFAALREFANPTPPKPEEPTGLGAVVEDAEGEKWVRLPIPDFDKPWTDAAGVGLHVHWSRVNAVRILSEGVQS